MRTSRYRWLVVVVFLLFVLLHQADKLVISPLTQSIMDEYSISKTEMGAVSTAALLVSALLYPLWGYLYDRYARARLLALASCLWACTTWLNARARTYPVFLATRGSTGIDDSSYPGMWSLLADYFEPRLRGKVYGLIQLAQPLGFAAGTLLASSLSATYGWRSVFYVTGGLGLAVSALILLAVREPQRGHAEPELAGVAEITKVRFDKRVALGLLRKPSYLVLLGQGFFGVFPWWVLVFWFYNYLETERDYARGDADLAMMVAILTLAAGYYLGGAVGDLLFRRTPRGRALTAMVGVIAGAVFLVLALSVPTASKGLFLLPLALTGLTMSVAAPNVVATVQDVAEPEVRGTAQAMMSLADNIGSALAPLIAGIVGDAFSLHVAILTICVSAWAACAVLFGVTAWLVPQDIARLRGAMRARAELEGARGT